ncbi:MAG: caspase family protein [Nitrospirae bacterium]|nr:caspase family protein [Nitrospirota bacterium]MBF0616890.1 caspase family protein [Nitrospirota bacterium]
MDILSGGDLSYQFSSDTSGAIDALANAYFSLDGKYLYAGGMVYRIRKWSNGGKGTYKDILTGSVNTIEQIVPLKNGGIVFGSTDPAFGVFDKNDKRRVFKQTDKADYRGDNENFQVSRDAKTIKFWYENKSKSPKVFSLTERELSDVSNSKENLFKPILESDKLNITNWFNEDYPKLNGTALQLQQYEMSRSLAILPNNSGFLLGTELRLRLFDSTGNEKWKVAAPGVVWDVNVSQNGKIAVAAYDDGTIRWYRVSDGKELLAFFPHKDKKRWVLWTPKGYYDASVGGDDLVGWHVNRGKDKEADFFPVSKFRDTYFRPNIVSKVLDTLDEDEAIKQANAQSDRKTPTAAVTETLPPVVKINSPIDGANVNDSEVTLEYEIRTPADAPVTSVMVLVNGVKQAVEKNVNKVNKTYKISALIPEKDNEISVIAVNKYESSVPATVALGWKEKVKKDEEFLKKPKLYVLAIGISNYKDEDNKLMYSSKDAKDFAGVMEKQKGLLYRDVEVKVITDEIATRMNVLDGFDWILNNVTNKDIAMVLLSGHGYNDPDGAYYYIPVDVDLKRIKSTAVIFTEIKNTVNALAGKKLFL